MQLQGTAGIDQTWLDAIGGEFNKSYLQDLAVFLNQEAQQGKTI